MKRSLFELAPDYRERVWGGPMLTAANNAAGGSGTIGEAWLVYDGSRIRGGMEAGRSLGEIIAGDAERLLGPSVRARFGARLPLLAKILETADWLSIQVHPDDEQARRMVGPDEFGKTEAWYFLDAEKDARILAGVKPGVDRERAAAAIRSGNVRDVMAELPIVPGDALFIPAGMLHGLGPGLLVYEIQQHSDTTYRAYDWDRPMSAGRKLHVEECVEVVRPHTAETTRPALPSDAGTCTAGIVDCPYFDVDVALLVPGQPLVSETKGTFHLLTVTEGAVAMTAGDERLTLRRFESAFVSADTRTYELASNGRSVVVRSAAPTAS